MPRVDLGWLDLALCAQMPIEMVSDNHSDSVLAQQVCALCEVRPECLAYSLAEKERWGVWGGMPQETRQKLIGDDEDADYAGDEPGLDDQNDDVKAAAA